MAAFRDVEVTFSFDYSKDLNRRIYSPEVLQKSLEELNQSKRILPLAVKVGGHHFEIGQISKIEVDGTIIKYTAKILQIGSIEVAETKDLEVSKMDLRACSMMGGLPLYLGID